MTCDLRILYAPIVDKMDWISQLYCSINTLALSSLNDDTDDEDWDEVSNDEDWDDEESWDSLDEDDEDDEESWDALDDSDEDWDIESPDDDIWD